MAKKTNRSERIRSNLDPLRSRLTFELSTDYITALDTLNAQFGKTKADIAREALEIYFRNLGYETRRVHEDVSGERLIRHFTIRNRKQVLFHSRLLIRAFEEALAYDPKRHHNKPPPEL